MGFVTDWGGQPRPEDIEQALNERSDTGNLRRKLLKIGPIVNTKANKEWRIGSL